MDLQLEGKRAIVTGGSRGIGRAIARALALEGCDVAICARTESTLRAAADELSRESGRRIIPIVADVSDAESILGFVAEAARSLGGVDILINNAAKPAGSLPDNLYEMTDEAYLEDFNEKVLGFLRCARACAPHLKRGGSGRVVNIAGVAARTPGTRLNAGMRSAAIMSMTKGLANTLGPDGVTVNCIYPALTLTDGIIEARRAQAEREGTTLEAVLERAAQSNPLRHNVTPEEIAHVAAFLCSPLAIGISGEAIAVAAGIGSSVRL